MARPTAVEAEVVGLFSHHPDHREINRTNRRAAEPWEGRSVGESLRVELGYDRPKVVALDVVDPLALLAIHACRTGQFDKVPQWLSGGHWGSEATGHVISGDLERWFDRAKLEAYYQAERPRLEARGYTIGQGWYPESPS